MTTERTNKHGAARRRYTVVGVTAGLLAGGAAGAVIGVPGLSSAASLANGAVVQQDDITDDTTDETTDDSVGDATTATRMATHLREALQSLVDDGTITSEQADAVAERLVAERPGPGERGMGRGEMGRGSMGRGEMGDRGMGRGDMGQRGDMGERGPFGAAFGGDVVAGLLGIDVDTLHAELLDGATIAELAESNGVEPQSVIEALVADATERVELSVEQERLTREEADERIAELTERITTFVNEGGPRHR